MPRTTSKNNPTIVKNKSLSSNNVDSRRLPVSRVESEAEEQKTMLSYRDEKIERIKREKSQQKEVLVTVDMNARTVPVLTEYNKAQLKKHYSSMEVVIKSNDVP